MAKRRRITDEPVTIYRAANAAEAYAVQNLLAEEGISAEIVGEVIASTWGFLPGRQTGPSVVVPSGDATHAREVVNAQLATIPRTPNRPWQFSVRALLITMTVVAIVAAICGQVPYPVLSTIFFTALLIGEIAAPFIRSYREIDRTLNPEKYED
ncbi:putative signal transducing protein [Aeoliella sp. SH292]|uniref:putative signal transducing protein n=1 Tax=Aeoliella sp. SH292 TaxID=3454464 RepID=UPI003F955AFE